MVAIPARRITGRALTVMVGAARHTPARHMLAQVFREQLGINAVRNLRAEAMAPLPASTIPVSARPPRAIAPNDWGPPRANAGPWTAARLSERFAEHTPQTDSVALS